MNRIRGLANKDEQGFAMLSVILLMLVVTFFATVLLGIVLAQTGPTLLSNKNSRTQGAAQAGVEATIAQLRNAESIDGSGLSMGDIHKLPCSVTGTVDGTGGANRYVAKVQYFVADPKGQTSAWRTTNALACYTGTGANGGVRSVPHFAVINSQGYDDTAIAKAAVANRVVEATYQFQLTTRKVSGGMILDANSAYCLVADTATAGSLIRYQLASSADCASQTDENAWSWRDDYMIHLTSSDKDGKTPLCLSGRAPATGISYMTLKACYTGADDPNGQRWSWTGDYTWRGQNAANTNYANTYIVNEDANVDANDRLSVSSGPTNKSLTPVGAVGKGNASYATHQVVNQTYFGRCLDVTNANIVYSYMIAYPCKQDPSGAGAFDWNHKWYYSEPAAGVESVVTQITVNNGSNYCLITNNTAGLTGNPGSGTHKTMGIAPNAVTISYPRFVKSDNTSSDCASATTKWTRYGYSNDVKKAYTFIDSNGMCLDAGGPNIDPEDTSGAKAWTSIVVAPCDGSDDQKWNVPDAPNAASIGDYQEVTGRSG